jgi:hypothetical protein
MLRSLGKKAAHNLPTVNEKPLMYTAIVYSQEGIHGSPSMARLASRAKPFYIKLSRTAPLNQQALKGEGEAPAMGQHTGSIGGRNSPARLDQQV